MINKANKGKLIVLEGVDGSGKSTAAKYLYNSLQLKGIDCVITREIGGTEIAEELRNISFSKYKRETIDPNARLLMLYAARIQHIKNVIEPAIEAGKIVICDRYIYSSYVYQGLTDGLMESIKNLENNPATSFLSKAPDYLIYFTISAETSVERNKTRQAGNDTHYKQNKEFAQKLNDNYNVVISEYRQKHNNVIEIDGEASIPVIQKQLDNFIRNAFF